MVMPAGFGCDDPALEVLTRVAREIAVRLGAVADWGETGLRRGQYLADVDVDDVAVSILVDAGFAVLSEESGHSGDGGRLVVLDPLDGSTNASRGIPWFATSMCVVDDLGPAVALVANQASGESFAAVRGQGAWSADRRLHVSAAAHIAVSVIGISGTPGSSWDWWQFRALGAAALDLGLVASGSLDGYVDMSDDAHGPWDYLGGMLLVSEAGGAITDAFDRDLVVLQHDQRRTPVAAASPELLDVLLTRRRQTAPRDG